MNYNRRRTSRAKYVWIAIAVLFIAFLWFLYSRGGEQPQARVEKVIPAERLGQ